MILEWTGTPLIDTLVSMYGSNNTTPSGVLGAGKLRNDVMIYYANASSRTLRYANFFKVEANLQLF